MIPNIIIIDTHHQNISKLKPNTKPVYLHDRQKLVQEVSCSEKHLKAIVKIVVEQTEPLYHPVPVMAVDKFRLVTPL